MRRFRLDNRGNAAVLFALVFPVVGAGTGMAVDYANLARMRTALQETADGAALAAAREMALAQYKSDGERTRLATEVAGHFIDIREPDARRVVTASLDEGSVRIDLSSDGQLFLGGLTGLQESGLSVTATATYKAVHKACLLALGADEPVGIALQGAPSIAAPNCGVWSNSRGEEAIAAQGAPKVTASEVCAVGGAASASRKTQPPARSHCAPAPDPFLGRIPEPERGCFHRDAMFGASNKTVHLRPGVYCGGIVAQGVDIRLDPGLYTFRNGPLLLHGSGSLTGEGVSLLFEGENAVLDIQGSPQVRLSAMNTGPLKGIAIAAAESAPGTSIIQGSPDLEIDGAIYLPHQSLRLHGSPTLRLSGARDKLVARSYALQGSPDIVIDAANPSDPEESLSFLRLIR